MPIEKSDNPALVEKLASPLTDEAQLFKLFIDYRNTQTFRGTNDTDYRLIFIERFVADCITSHQPGYLIVNKAPGKTEFKGRALARSYFHQLNRYLDRFSKDCFFSPPVELFFSACQALSLIGHQFIGPEEINAQGVTDAELFNRLINKIREMGRTSQYRKRMAKDNRRAFRKFLGLVNYVDALFEHVRSRFIVIRLDLKYHPEFAKDMKVGQAQDDLKHFFDNMRSKPSLFDDLAGYIWKMECGDHGGEHFHVFMFFTNDRMQNDCYRAQQIGKYWEEIITKGRGSYFNCNAPEYADKFDHLGLLAIGRVEYHDDNKRFNLLTPLAYICKGIQSVRAKPKQKSRTFGRGEMPPVRDSQSGRPRSVMCPPRAYLRNRLGLTRAAVAAPWKPEFIDLERADDIDKLDGDFMMLSLSANNLD